jgi:gliding motility-associated-like protein
MVVTVIPYCVKVMNAFTPNGDGTNDRWLVTNGAGCTNLVKVRVFNRYGQEVYNNENYQNNWDGCMEESQFRMVLIIISLISA